MKCGKSSLGLAVLIVMAILVVCGIILVYSFVENIEYNTNVFYADADNKITGVEYNEKVQNLAKSATKSILGNNVKVNISGISPNGDRIICYTKNVYIELDAISMHPVVLIYECQKGESKLSEEKCMGLAMRFALQNIPRKTKVNGAKVERISFSGGEYLYKIIFSEESVFVSVRADTGSIVYYDATMLF